MLLQWLDVRLARVGLLIAFIAITVLALLPQAQVSISTHWDKLDHWLAFFTLSFLMNHAFPQRSFWRFVVISLVLYGVGIEIAQSLTPDRDADLRDVVADSIGILIYGAILQCRLLLAKQQLAD
jgi:VanZ family protein